MTDDETRRALVRWMAERGFGENSMAAPLPVLARAFDHMEALEKRLRLGDPQNVQPTALNASYDLFASTPRTTVASQHAAPTNPIDPFTQDVLADPPHPPTMVDVHFESHGALLNGVIYIASGAGPHPTVMLLHGFPGNERNLDLAHLYCRAGINALVFHYRGAWGSQGDYSYANTHEDANVVLDFLLNGDNAKRYRIDVRRVAVAGYSAGALTALMLAAKRFEVAVAISIGGGNLSALARKYEDADARRRLEQYFDSELKPLRGTTGAALVAELMAFHDEWDLHRYAPELARKPLLLVSELATRSETHDGLAAAIRAAGGQPEERLYPCDHSYMTHRVALARDTLAFLQRNLLVERKTENL